MLALLAAFALVLAMAVPAFADEVKYTITIKNSVGTYEAYQIFKGDLAGNVLSNIEWGTGVKAEEVKAAFGGKTAAEVARTLEDDETAAAAKAFATKISGYLDTTAAVEGTDKITGLSAGYYLIKNKSVNEGEAYTDFILQVVKDVEITPKGQKPTLDKQIKHNESGKWGVVGDNQIGDTVEFRTITTVPNTTGYTKYDYTIFDEMSTGLTSSVTDASGITIKINDGEELDSRYYTVTVDSTDANKFSVKVDILKAITDGKIEAGNSLYTYYTGVLNKDAKVYDEGNQKNTAYLQYSNNPHDNTSQSETPKVTVYDWTFKMNVQKVDGANADKELAGAKFVLSKNGAVDLGAIDENGTPAKTENLIKLVYDSTDSTYRVATANDATTTYVMTAGNITIKGLDDAEDYYLYETKAPAGYNRLTEPVKFRINATYTSADSRPDVLTKVGDKEAASGLKVSVENNAGTTLPSTGGMGTTVFYVVGGGLMAVAVVLLVTKKRMENKR